MEERFVAEVHPLDIRAHSGVALKRKEVRESRKREEERRGDAERRGEEVCG